MKRLFEVDTICRLCLRADEKVCRLNNTDQKVFIESIINLKHYFNYVPTDDLYICYICNALLTKSFNFMQTIWSAQKIISAILKNTNMITKQQLYCIDRHKTGLNPITLSSVVTYCDNVECDSSNNTSSGSDTSTDIEELDLDLLIKKIETRKQMKPNKNKINYHSTNENTLIISDEDEESDKCNLETKEKPVIKKNVVLKKEPSLPTTSKQMTSKIKDKKRKYIEIYIEDDDENSTYNEKTRINVNKEEIDDDHQPDLTSHSEDTGEDKGKPIKRPKDCIVTKPVRKKNGALKESPSVPSISKDSISNEKKRKYVEIDSDDMDSLSDEKKRKYDKEDIEYQPDSSSHSEDSDYDLYDDEGKLIKRPKDGRVYPMQCDHCDFEVLEKRNHYHHYLYMHPNIEYPYKLLKEYACSICGKLYGKQKIGSHEASHTTQKLKCYFCPKVFSNIIRRQRHVQTVHPRKTFTCDYCSKIFKTKNDITRHFRTHTGSKPFKCHICGDGFAHSGNRSIHIRAKHQNNYKYVSKKQKRAQKVHRNKKHYSTDAEIPTNSGKTVRKTKTKRKSNNQSEKTEMTLKKKRKCTKQGSKNKKVGATDTAMVSEDGKQYNTKEMIIQIVSDTNIEEGSKNCQNAEIESDDEILAVIKRKNTQDGPQSPKAKQIDKENKAE